MYDSINIREVGRINTNNPNNIILDIRDKYEYILEHIPKAINIPYNYLNTIPQNYLNFDNRYFIYCNNGVKSKKLCEYLCTLGYKCVDLVGGYNLYLDDI